VQQDKAPTLQGWTGLKDVNTQDESMKWGQGRADRNGIVDRSKEHLGTTDAMIIRMRRLILDAAKALRDNGTTPPALETPEVYSIRPGWVVLPAADTANWFEVMKPLREGFRNEVAVEASPAS
jgi:hypothetical protein